MWPGTSKAKNNKKTKVIKSGMTTFKSMIPYMVVKKRWLGKKSRGYALNEYNEPQPKASGSRPKDLNSPQTDIQWSPMIPQPQTTVFSYPSQGRGGGFFDVIIKHIYMLVNVKWFFKRE